MDQVPAIQPSKIYLKQLKKEKFKPKVKYLTEILTLTSIKLQNRNIHTPSEQHLNNKVLYKHSNTILRELKKSEGTIQEIEITNKDIKFKHKESETDKVEEAIEKINTKGLTFDNLKSELQTQKGIKEIKPTEKKTIHVLACEVCTHLEGKPRILSQSSLSTHFKKNHSSLEYTKMEEKEKAILLKLQKIILSREETGISSNKTSK